MIDSTFPSCPRPGRPAWNKGKLTGPKPPLRPGHVWSIRAKLQLERRTRDLAMFNLAIDSKLRGCDLIGLRVDDVAPNGYAVDRATVRQRKTGRPVRFELTEVTRQALDDYLRASGRKPGQCLFPGRRGPNQPMTTRQYARLVGAMGSDLATSVLSANFLFWASDSVAERTVSTTLSMAYSDMFRVNWPDSIFAMSSTVLMRPSRCLPLERMRVRDSNALSESGP
jgi:hypothetical protein